MSIVRAIILNLDKRFSLKTPESKLEARSHVEDNRQNTAEVIFSGIH